MDINNAITMDKHMMLDSATCLNKMQAHESNGYFIDFITLNDVSQWVDGGIILSKKYDSRNPHALRSMLST